MAVKRTNTNRSAMDTGAVISASFNQYSGGSKVTNAGPALEIIGTLGTEKSVGPGASLLIYNNSGAVGFVAFYSAGEIAPVPASLTTGIPVPANSWLAISSGVKSIIVGSAATLGVYKMIDDTRLTVDDNQGN